jgi:hypothetical protein
MGEVIKMMKSSEETILPHIDELREKVANGEYQAVFVFAWTEDYSDMESMMLGMLDMDLVELLGALELIKDRVKAELR